MSKSSALATFTPLASLAPLATEALPLPITITPAALAEVRHIMQHKNIPADYALRVGVRGGGCGGMGYMLGFDKPKDHDEAYTQGPVPVVIEKKHLLYVLGVTLDFQEGDAPDSQRGFLFRKD
jgi:iron-sulfur cluster assembly protein